MSSTSTPKFTRFAWFVLGYNLLVIMWGAFVRATGSGAGCGNHWPLCNGEVVPRPESVETMIEFSHRLTSGLDGFLVLGLLIAAFRTYPKRHRVRLAAVVSMVFLISEALLGAGLVRFGLVADNDSIERAYVMAAHLLNTFFLVAALTLTAAWSGGLSRPRRPLHRQTAWLALGGILLLLLVSVSGAIAALGDTLFPAESLREGIAQDLSPTAHILVRLRVFHPIIAIGATLLLGALALKIQRLQPTAAVTWNCRFFLTMFGIQLGIGFVNLALAAPVWLQLVHLLAADLVWIGWILLAASALAAELPATAAAPATSREPLAGVPAR
ncbi:MAG: COX15/CtaA family protein [Acidobacteriota bacterium]